MSLPAIIGGPKALNVDRPLPTRSAPFRQTIQAVAGRKELT
jgi:hypothetical protein